MMNWKGFGRMRSLPNSGCIRAVSWKGWGDQQKVSFTIPWCHGRDSTPVLPEFKRRKLPLDSPLGWMRNSEKLQALKETTRNLRNLPGTNQTAEVIGARIAQQSKWLRAGWSGFDSQQVHKYLSTSQKQTIIHLASFPLVTGCWSDRIMNPIQCLGYLECKELHFHSSLHNKWISSFTPHTRKHLRRNSFIGNIESLSWMIENSELLSEQTVFWIYPQNTIPKWLNGDIRPPFDWTIFVEIFARNFSFIVYRTLLLKYGGTRHK
jgi:hypothetical protein